MGKEGFLLLGALFSCLFEINSGFHKEAKRNSLEDLIITCKRNEEIIKEKTELEAELAKRVERATISGWNSPHDDIEVVGAVDNSVTLACDAARDTAMDDVITWTDTAYASERGKLKLIFTSKDNGPFQPNSNHVNHASYQIDKNTYALTINNIKTDDVGTYICRNERTRAYTSYYLNVYDGLKCEGRTDLGEGDRTSIRCSTRFSGYSTPKLVWYREGQRLESNVLYDLSAAAGVLAKIEEVLTVQATDDGKELRCEMNFAGKTDHCSLKLNVSYLCNDIEFKCHSNSCIPKAWVCDNYTDCDDGSDETNCDYDLTTRSQYYTTPRYSNCNFAEFHCDDKCITNSWVCDNYPDCNDGTDEVNCGHGTTRGPQFWSTESSWSPAGCNYTEFHCDDKCIPNNWVCDNYGDCSDGSDEANCAGTTQRYTTYSYNGRRQDLCDSSEYLCDSIKCIPESWVCDNYTDCNDNLDEMYCGSGDGYVTDGNLAFTTPRYCNFTEFQCDIDKCIRDSWVCDGYYDCADGTDEGNCGGTTSYEFPDSYTTESNRFFKCLHTGELIPEEFVCDNYTDCRDDTDEENCQVA